MIGDIKEKRGNGIGGEETNGMEHTMKGMGEGGKPAQKNK